MKSLNTIQTLAKIGRVLSKIMFIISIVGLVFCVLGVTAMAMLPEAFEVGETTVGVYELGEFTRETAYAAMGVAIVALIVEIILSKKAEIYFRHEIAEGQPFTEALSKELRDLGILQIALSIGSAIVIGVGLSIAKKYFDGIDEKLAFDYFPGIGLGITFLIVSVICRYGAAVRRTDAEESKMPDVL